MKLVFDEHHHANRFRTTPGVFVCEHVANQGMPVLYVSHDGHGDWQFLCGAAQGDGDKPVLMHVSHLLAIDPALDDLASLRCNDTAERAAVGAAWSTVDSSEALIRSECPGARLACGDGRGR